MSSELFRFLSQRAPQTNADESVLSPIATESEWQRAVGVLASQANMPAMPVSEWSPDDWLSAARILVGSEEWIPDLAASALPLRTLNTSLIRVEDYASPAKVRKFVEAAVDASSVEAFVRGEAFHRERMRFAASLVATLLVSDAGASPAREALTRGLRILTLLERLGQTTDASLVHSVLARTVLLLPRSFPSFNTNLARAPRVGELNIVRQRLVRYELGDIAHIENALRGEHRERKHRRLDTRDEVTTFEEERLEERDEELQTAERFELQREATAEAHSAQQFEAGVTVTGSYGPAISVTADARYGSQTSRDEATRQAVTLAREVTQRAAKRIQSRVRHERVVRTRTEIEETNTHGIDNRGSSDHIVGTYRYVDKVYSAQVYSYGRRLLLDFVVPEPAAFFLEAESRTRAGNVGLAEPSEPRFKPLGEPERELRPGDLTVDNIQPYIGQYKVAGIKPPPPTSVHAATTFEIPSKPQLGHGPFNTFNVWKDLTVPDGYQGHKLRAQVFLYHDDGYGPALKRSRVDIAVGVSRVGAEGVGPVYSLETDMKGETGTIGVAVATDIVRGMAVSIVAEFARQSETLAKWQYETYEAVYTAYLEQRQAYEEQVARAGADGPIRLHNRNPEDNRRLEQRELHRLAVEMLVNQHFDESPLDRDAIVEDPRTRMPVVDFDVARRKRDLIQFIEQAFEWNNMTYVFYPYYWGRQTTWPAAVTYSDDDPLFAAFVTSGAARISLPARPGFEGAVGLFLATGILWNASEVPQVDDPLYVAVAQELREQSQSPGHEVQVGSAWEVRLPTSLVTLSQEAPAL